MDEQSRILGMLEEFRRSSEHRLEKIEGKIDALQFFKWKVAGALTALVTGVEMLAWFLKAKGGR